MIAAGFVALAVLNAVWAVRAAGRNEPARCVVHSFLAGVLFIEFVLLL